MKQTSLQSSSEQTAAVRADVVRAAVASVGPLTKAEVRTDTRDIDAVERIARDYEKLCFDNGLLPNFEGFCSALGMSRKRVYQKIAHAPDSDFSIFADNLRTRWAAMRQAAMDRGASDVTAGIFVLLNSDLGYTNKHDVEITTTPQPLDTLATDQARARMLAALPEDEGD